MVDVADAVDLAARAGDADAEEVGRHLRQRRIDPRDGAVAVGSIPLVCLAHERLHTVGRGELPS